jgi:hypothetical protein
MLEGPLLLKRGSLMRPALFGAALLGSTALLAIAPAAHAQQYGGYAGGYGSYGQPNYGMQYGDGYTGGYGGGFNSTSPYAQVCAALSLTVATQGYAALGASPYAFTCQFLGLLSGAPGPSYGLGGLGTYGASGSYGQPGYSFSGGGAYYGVSGSVNGLGYPSSAYAASNYGGYEPYWPYTTP